jgi:hypothetical protein
MLEVVMIMNLWLKSNIVNDVTIIIERQCTDIYNSVYELNQISF